MRVGSITNTQPEDIMHYHSGQNKKSFRATMILMTFNQENTVEEAVRSCLDQDSEPIEILISDDCSTDNTWEIVKKSVDNYTGPHKITLNKNTRNLGLIEHYNFCFKKALGDFIIVCARDDISYPLRTRKILTTFERTNALLIFSQINLNAVNSSEQISEHKIDQLFLQTTNMFHAARADALVVGATCAYSKELFQMFGFLPDNSLYEDIILGFRACLEKRVVMLEEQLVHYRLGGLSTNSKARAHNSIERRKLRIETIQSRINILRIHLESVNKSTDRNRMLYIYIYFLLFKYFARKIETQAVIFLSKVFNTKEY